MNALLAALSTWWHTRVQKDIATAAIAVSAVDFTPWADDLADFVHWKHWHSALHILFGVGVYWRAHQATRAQS